MDTQNSSSILNFIKSNFIGIIVVTIMIIIIYFLFQLMKDNALLKEELAKKPVVLTQEQAKDPNYLRNELNMDKQAAEKTTVIIEKAQQGQIQPQGTVVVQAPTVEKAVERVYEKIETKDPTMAPEALEKSDRTIVAPQPENEEYKVGVYKINLQKKNSIGIGVGRMDGKTYIPVSYERMYAKNKSIEIQVNLTPGEKKIVSGGQIMHKWYF